MTKKEQNLPQKRYQHRVAKNQLLVDKTQSSSIDQQIGQVIARFQQHVAIEDSQGCVFRCTMRAHLADLVTGDQVYWQAVNDHEGVVTTRLPRHNVLARFMANGKSKALAANVDLMFIVIAAEPVPRADLIDRYLVIAENSRIAAQLIINKTDLLKGSNHLAQRLGTFYQSLGYPLLTTSTQMVEELTPLYQRIAKQTAILVGQSGVGKSSLIKALLPHESPRIGALSTLRRQGRQTTTTTQLYHLANGGQLLDSPGIRTLNMANFNLTQLITGFVELRSGLGHCQYRNCTHTQEPGCAILARVSSGEITSLRWQSFCQLRTLMTPSSQFSN